MAYYIAVYNQDRKRWELSWEGDKAHEYYTPTEALSASTLAARIEGIAHVKVLQEIPVNYTFKAQIVSPESFDIPEDQATASD